MTENETELLNRCTKAEREVARLKVLVEHGQLKQIVRDACKRFDGNAGADPFHRDVEAGGLLLLESIDAVIDDADKSRVLIAGLRTRLLGLQTYLPDKFVDLHAVLTELVKKIDEDAQA